MRTRSDNSEAKLISATGAGKILLDARLIGWFIFYTGFVALLIGVLLVTGVGQFVSRERRLVLFGIVCLVSEVSHGVYLSCISAINVISGYGLARGRKFGWWCGFGSSVIFGFDGILMFPQHQYSAMISIAISVAIIIWLIFRRRFYKIRISGARNDV